MEFAKNMYELHKRVSPSEVIIGWWEKGFVCKALKEKKYIELSLFFNVNCNSGENWTQGPFGMKTHKINPPDRAYWKGVDNRV